MWQSIAAGVPLGIISSFHCVGMCGPIALALPVKNLTGAAKRGAMFLYHIGRVITYCTLGLLFGLLGRHFYLAGFQKALSITAGGMILLFVLLQWFHKKWRPTPAVHFLFGAVQNGITILWSKTAFIKFLVIGLLNGLLPCGMVYFALAGALSFASPLNSSVFMMGFGIGTLPLMLLVHMLGLRYLSIGLRSNIKKALPFFIFFMGTVLILRGLNLGIPFLSPYLGKAPQEVITCH